MKKIETLTAEQEARLIEFREEWLKIGLATGPVDLPVVERQCLEVGRLNLKVVSAEYLARKDRR